MSGPPAQEAKLVSVWYFVKISRSFSTPYIAAKGAIEARLCYPFQLFMRTVGGEVAPASTLAPKIGPLGMVSKQKAVPKPHASCNTVYTPTWCVNLTIQSHIIFTTVSQEGRWWYHEGYNGLERSESDREADCHQQTGDGEWSEEKTDWQPQGLR